MAEIPDHAPLGLLLRLVHQQWTQAVDEALDAAGFGDIRPPHANVFTFVSSDGTQVSELTRLARVRKQTMTQAVEELEALGYVERRPDPSDRRARLVFLTDRGLSVRPIAVAAGRSVDQHWAGLTSRETIDELRRSLQDLLDRLVPAGDATGVPRRASVGQEIGQRAGVHDGQALGGPGEGDVERP